MMKLPVGIEAWSGWSGGARRAVSCLLLLSCLGGANRSEAKLNVVATTADFGVLAEEIGGKAVKVTVLAKPTEDPHFVDAKPSFMVKLNRADLLIDGGAELELGWLPSLVQGARNRNIAKGQPGRLSAAEGMRLMGIPTELDRSKGDIHAMGNPHFMVDPVRSRQVADRIADAFCGLDAKSCGLYRANLAEFHRKLDAKLEEWESALSPFKGRSLVAYHDSWGYFAERFGLRLDLFLEPKPGIPPTPSHLAAVARQMKEENARVILLDPYVNRKTAERLAESTGAKVIDVTHFPGGVQGATNGYLELMDYLVTQVATALNDSK